MSGKNSPILTDLLVDPVPIKMRQALETLDIPEGEDQPRKKGQRRATVFMPLVKRDDWHVIFTQRPDTMPTHAGQVSFPGGKIEVGETPEEAACREVEEEIGLSREDLVFLGRLPSFNAAYDFRVTPFVGLVSPTAQMEADAYEVAEIFEVPFRFLMNPNNHIPREATYEGRQFMMYEMPFRGEDGIHRHIWGMTAMIIYRLYQRGFCDEF